MRQRVTRLPGRVWASVAVLGAVVGTAVSWIAAETIASRDAERAHADFEQAAAEVVSTLELAIQHEQDLMLSTSGFVRSHPGMRSTALAAWLRDVRAIDRYPELRGIAVIELVAHVDLPAFVARAAGNQAGVIGRDGSISVPPSMGAPYVVVPPGERAHHCLSSSSVGRSGLAVPMGLDLCAGDFGESSSLMRSRDTGTASYEPVRLDDDTVLLGLQVPLYRSGAVPTSVEARRDAFIGWLGMAVDPQAVIDRALAGNRGLDVALRFRNDHSDVTIGDANGGVIAAARDFGNGWTATVSGPSVTADVLSGEALQVGVAGTTVTALLFVLVYVLATGRERARRLVEQRTDELRHQALHDPMTGLANRALIMDRIEQLLARSRRHGSVGAALYLDLDGFKAVNDTLGHDAGDQLLQAVSQRLLAAVREADTIGRLGGDEFVVLIDGSALDAAPALVAERLLAVLRQPFELDASPAPVRISGSIGVAIGDRENPGDLLRDADTALYQAKANGRDRYEVFGPEMETTIRQDFELEVDLHSALEDGQFRLAYQPIYDLDNLTLTGVEALLRWDHPTRGLLAPAHFIDLLERTGQIIEVGRWVLLEACEQTARWRDQGTNLTVSVNVSPHQLNSDRIIEHVREALALTGLDPAALTIEITESALMGDLDRSRERLATIKALGVHVAIDDFGTGYSSLAHLERLPVDTLKIDRSFISAMSGSSEARAIVRTIVQLGKDLGLKTLAEGIETPVQIDELRGESVDEAQGFLLARPLDPATFESTVLLVASAVPSPNQGSAPSDR